MSNSLLKFHLMLLFLVNAFAGGSFQPAEHGKSLRQLKLIYGESKCEANWQPPIRAELESFEMLVELTIRPDADLAQLSGSWAKHGWQFTSLQNGKVRVIAESPESRLGKGLYVIRPLSNSKLVLQAPHRFYDLHTGKIALAMFEKFDVFAAAWNTSHRKKVDLTHTQTHYLNRFTRALMRTSGDCQVVQLHGFANELTEGGGFSPAKTNAAPKLIVSDSTKVPGRVVRSTVLALKKTYGAENALLFPLETHRLGGTKNVQANLLKSLGANQFVHLELSLSLRQQLTGSASELKRFFQAIAPK